MGDSFQDIRDDGACLPIGYCKEKMVWGDENLIQKPKYLIKLDIMLFGDNIFLEVEDSDHILIKERVKRANKSLETAFSKRITYPQPPKNSI
jgi:hypothetical protein